MSELVWAAVFVAIVGVGGWALVRLSRSRGQLEERVETLEETADVQATIDEVEAQPLRSGDDLWDSLRERAAADELRRDDPQDE